MLQSAKQLQLKWYQIGFVKKSLSFKSMNVHQQITLVTKEQQSLKWSSPISSSIFMIIHPTFSRASSVILKSGRYTEGAGAWKEWYIGFRIRAFSTRAPPRSQQDPHHHRHHSLGKNYNFQSLLWIALNISFIITLPMCCVKWNEKGQSKAQFQKSIRLNCLRSVRTSCVRNRIMTWAWDSGGDPPNQRVV